MKDPLPMKENNTPNAIQLTDIKEYYKIGEITELFGIGADSIRYYEKKKLISPTRNTVNNYRLYSLQDIKKITDIRELLALGFSTDDILRFEENKTLENTEHLFETELNYVEKQIKDLFSIQSSIKRKLKLLQHAKKLNTDETVYVKHFNSRPIEIISETRIADNQVPLTAVRKQRSENRNIDLIGACDCYTLDLENSIPEHDYYLTHNVFLYYPEQNAASNAFLPAGDYLSLCYKGHPKRTKDLMHLLYDYAKTHDLDILGMPIEFDYISHFESGKEEEFIIEIQLPVTSVHTSNG